jgi:hypothetical protein
VIAQARTEEPVSEPVEQSLRYYFPAFAGGLALYYGRAVRVGICLRHLGQVRVYDPHRLLADRALDALAAGELPEMAGRAPGGIWTPSGEPFGVVAGGPDDARAVVVIEVPNWSLDRAPIRDWGERFLQYGFSGLLRPEYYSALENYAPLAVQEAARSVFYGDSARGEASAKVARVVAPYLRQLCAIATRREEGELPEGALICADAEDLRVAITRRVVPSVTLQHTKHVRKIVQMAGSSGLVHVGCTPTEVVGFLVEQSLPGRFVRVRLEGNGVATVSVRGAGAGEREVEIATYRGARFSGVPVRPDPAVICSDLIAHAAERRITLDARVAAGVAELACRASLSGHGAMIVVGGDQRRLFDQGQGFDPPLDVTHAADMDQLAAISTVDGAVLVSRSGEVHRGATLVDGAAVGGYDHSRGARHNSAMRYTSNDRGAIVVTISEDGPYAIFIQGIDVSAVAEVAHPTADDVADGALGPLPDARLYAKSFVESATVATVSGSIPPLSGSTTSMAE